MRVRLAAKQDRATLGGPRVISVVPWTDRKQARVLSAPVDFGLSDSTWLLTDARGGRSVIPRSGFKGQDPLVITPVGPSGITFGSGVFPGEVRLVPRRDGAAEARTFDVIEHIPLEQYLPGVISRELFANWSLDTFKAQVVAARSYALHERARSIGEGAAFDLEASQQDQAYNGATANPTAIRAAAETRGQVLKWNGQVLRAYYSSCCGGRPGSAKDTWPTRAGFEFNLAEPIQARVRDFDCPCNASQRYRWTVSRDRGELVRRLAAYGRSENFAIRGLSSLSKVIVATVNNAGRPASYRISDASGKWYTLSAEQLRLACNFTGNGAGESIPLDAKARVSSGDLQFTFTGDTVKIDGRGFGHGVGLCQFGAEGMAKQGKSWTDILKAYYPGAALDRMY